MLQIFWRWMKLSTLLLIEVLLLLLIEVLLLLLIEVLLLLILVLLLLLMVVLLLLLIVMLLLLLIEGLLLLLIEGLLLLLIEGLLLLFIEFLLLLIEVLLLEHLTELLQLCFVILLLSQTVRIVQGRLREYSRGTELQNFQFFHDFFQETDGATAGAGVQPLLDSGLHINVPKAAAASVRSEQGHTSRTLTC
jgi:hypothetical protein